MHLKTALGKIMGRYRLTGFTSGKMKEALGIKQTSGKVLVAGYHTDTDATSCTIYYKT